MRENKKISTHMCYAAARNLTIGAQSEENTVHHSAKEGREFGMFEGVC